MGIVFENYRLKMLKVLLLFIALFALTRADDKEKEDTFCGKKNCYEILGVSEKATAKEIKASYRKLSRTYHPDKNDSLEALEIMKEVNMAQDVLSNEKRKEKYDELLRIRKSLDAPRENAVVVSLGMLILCVWVVYRYQKETYNQVKRQLIQNPK